MIYLDYAATTPCLPEVIDAMLPYFRTSFGNAASVDHAFGSAAKSAVDRAREQVAALCGANPEDVIFTSGATEANNLALNNNLRLITGTIEHPSIRDTAQSSSSARRVEWLATDSQGIYSIDQLNDCFNSSEPTMLSLMMVNNEIGTIQPMAELSSTARNHGAILHTDATQAVAYLALTMEHVDALSLSAHKIYGPKGVGALICKSRLRRHLSPTLYGGGHERGLRSGTLNVPGIVGFGCAADIAISERTKRTNHLTAVRSTFEDTLATIYRRKVRVNAKDSAAPHIMSITLDGVNGQPW